jgi:predicted DNA-binding protein with PD1-like motif
MEYRTVETTAEFVARFETDADWRTEIEDLARKEGIIAGWFTHSGLSGTPRCGSLITPTRPCVSRDVMTYCITRN